VILGILIGLTVFSDAVSEAVSIWPLGRALAWSVRYRHGDWMHTVLSRLATFRSRLSRSIEEVIAVPTMVSEDELDRY